MKEDFLHYVWKMKCFDFRQLYTTEGAPLEILDFGYHNPDAGADFLEAKIRLDGLMWCGNIEMHLQPADWVAHRHDENPNYQNVILHVVFDAPTEGGKKIPNLPTLELKSYINKNIFQKYWELQNNTHWIPCQHHFYKVPPFTKTLWLDRLLIERLKRKSNVILDVLQQNGGNWEETFWQFLAKSFGAKINTEPFEWLARVTPNLILAKNRHSLFQIEALLFGQAGFLDATFQEEYAQRLKQEYVYQRKKYQLSPISVLSWKFARLRPANFPTIRLAQLAQLVHRSVHLFSKVLELERLEDLGALFDITVTGYWLDHYRFDTPSVTRPKSFGEEAAALIVVNTIVPFLFAYGETRHEEKLRQRALDFLEILAAEKNHIIEGWQTLGVEPQTAAQTQSLIELKKQYCDMKRCTACSLGHFIMTH